MSASTVTGRRSSLLGSQAISSSLAVTVWFMDDGAADHAGVTLQTHSFTLEEVELLVDALRMRFDLAANPRRNRGRWVIYVRSASVRRLREILLPELLPMFVYKIELEPRRDHTLAPDSSGQGDDMVRPHR